LKPFSLSEDKGTTKQPTKKRIRKRCRLANYPLTAVKDAQIYKFGSLSPIVHNWEQSLETTAGLLAKRLFFRQFKLIGFVKNKNLW
jgi:hypothetical protein